MDTNRWTLLLPDPRLANSDLEVNQRTCFKVRNWDTEQAGTKEQCNELVYHEFTAAPDIT